MKSAKVTLATVAERAGVSVATVSKVLNQHDDVALATRRRVQGAIEEAGYQGPSHRRIDNSRPIIVMYFDGVETMYSATVMHGILSGGDRQGVELVVRLGLGDRSDSPETIEATLPGGCVGIVAVTTAMHGLRLLRSRTSLPIVAVDPTESLPQDWLTIAATNWRGARAATEHLLRLGHTELGWIGGPAESDASIDRLHGFHAALHSAGITAHPTRELYGPFSIDTGLTAGAKLLQSCSPPTAIVAGNDEIAIGVVQTAQRLGLSVPSDVSVTGFDDTPQASWTTPQLTTVRQPLAEMGGMAISMVLERATGKSTEPRQIQLATQLMVRESTAPPPSGVMGKKVWVGD